MLIGSRFLPLYIYIYSFQLLTTCHIMYIDAQFMPFFPFPGLTWCFLAKIDLVLFAVQSQKFHCASFLIQNIQLPLYITGNLKLLVRICILVTYHSLFQLCHALFKTTGIYNLYLKLLISKCAFAATK